MKTLFLLRHGKSGWDDPSLTDFERPLAKRGRKGADLLGRALGERGLRPQAVFCSTAVRARETIEIVAERIGIASDDVEYLDNLYLADAERLVSAVKDVDDVYASVLFCGHNPGMEEAARYFVPGGPAALPTCGFLEIRFSAGIWAEVSAENVEAFFFLTPKKLGAGED